MSLPTRIAFIALLFMGVLVADPQVRIAQKGPVIDSEGVIERIRGLAADHEVRVSFVTRALAASVHEYD